MNEIYIVYARSTINTEIEEIFANEEEAEKYVKYLIDNEGDTSCIVNYIIEKKYVYDDAGKALNIY